MRKEKHQEMGQDGQGKKWMGMQKGVALAASLAAAVAAVAVAGCLLAGRTAGGDGAVPDGGMVTAPDFYEAQGGSVLLLDDRAVGREEAAAVKGDALKDRNVYFAGFMDAVLSGSSTVRLENLPQNGDFLLQYIISDKDSGEAVFETDLIPSGQCVVWTPGETLGAGTYHLEFLMVPYYVDADGNCSALTSGSNEVCYQIR